MLICNVTFLLHKRDRLTFIARGRGVGRFFFCVTIRFTWSLCWGFVVLCWSSLIGSQIFKPPLPPDTLSVTTNPPPSPPAFYFYFPNFNREHAKAKKCWMEAIESDCKSPSDFFDMLKFELVDYNPFCANNRDPGATGNDQCHGVRDIKNPFNQKDNVSAAAGININASLALLLPLVSFLFALKV